MVTIRHSFAVLNHIHSFNLDWNIQAFSLPPFLSIIIHYLEFNHFMVIISFLESTLIYPSPLTITFILIDFYVPGSGNGSGLDHKFIISLIPVWSCVGRNCRCPPLMVLLLPNVLKPVNPTRLSTLFQFWSLLYFHSSSSHC